MSFSTTACDVDIFHSGIEYSSPPCNTGTRTPSTQSLLICLVLERVHLVAFISLECQHKSNLYRGHQKSIIITVELRVDRGQY